MSVSCGIVGLPNVGKSTLFNALTDNNILAANYPFATIEPNTGVVPVPDMRLDKLAELYDTQKIVPAAVTFVDIAGLVAGASQGEGLGNQFLGHIRSCSAIVQVVRAFNDTNVTHVDNEHDPAKDIGVINTELILADLQTAQKRLPIIEKLSKADPKIKTQMELLQKIISTLDSGKMVGQEIKSDDLDDSQKSLLHELQFLTTKPIIYLFNVDEDDLNRDERKQYLSKLVAPNPALFACAKLESELRGLDEIDRTELLESYGQKESSLIQLIHAVYSVLGLQSFLTAGEKEVRAWTITKGSTAPQAAGAIHSDFERGFIAAEVVNYNDLIGFGSLPAARSAGKVRTEGKTYIMQPDDIVEFRFNT